MTETPTYYAGIDVAKDRLDVMLRPSGQYLVATNDERGIRSVVRRLRKEDVALAVLEATGGLEQPVAAALALGGGRWRSSTPGRSGTSPRLRAS
jgi:transposase